MTKEEIETIFKEVIQSTPGVDGIMENDPEDNSPFNINPLKVIQTPSGDWSFIATLRITRKNNAKNIVKNITSLLRYKLSKVNQKVGHVNLFIGGLLNE